MLSLSRRAALAVAGSLLAGGVARAEGVPNLYHARHYGTDDQLWNALTAKAGIKVNVVSGDHDELIQRMLAEGAPRSSRIPCWPVEANSSATS